MSSEWAMEQADSMTAHTVRCMMQATGPDVVCECDYTGRRRTLALALDTAREQGRRDRDAEVAQARAEERAAIVAQIRDWAYGAPYLNPLRCGGDHISSTGVKYALAVADALERAHVSTESR